MSSSPLFFISSISLALLATLLYSRQSAIMPTTASNTVTFRTLTMLGGAHNQPRSLPTLNSPQFVVVG